MARQEAGYNGKVVWKIDLQGARLFSSLVEEWLESLQAGRGYPKPFSKTTIAGYKNFQRWLWKWSGQEPSIKAISTHTLRLAMDNMPVSKSSCGYSRKKNLLDAYRCFAKWLIKKGYAASSVLTGIEKLKPKRAKPARRPKVNATQFQQMLNAIESFGASGYYAFRIRLLVQFISVTGLRISEALAVDWKHIDFSNQSISLVGKGGKARIVPLPSKIHSDLLDWKKLYWNSGATLWNGWTYCAARQSMERLRQHLPFDITWHGLRRSAATDWARKGAAITNISTALGHSDIKTTQLYIEADNQEAVRCLNNLMAS